MKFGIAAKALSMIAAVVALASVAAAQNSIFQIVPTPNQYQFNNALVASSASSSADIWAVGNVAMHFDGTQWKLFPAPGAVDDPTNYLRGVLTFSTTLAVAAGGGDDKGQIVDRWNGQKWERVRDVQFPPDWLPFAMTMSGTSPKDIWVTGSIDPNQNYQLFFEHWNGSAWDKTLYLPGGVAFLYGASQDATNDAWVVGSQLYDNYTEPLIAHYNGNEWINAGYPFPDGTGELDGILALAPNNVWAVGWQNPGPPDYYTNMTLIYHYDGASWTIVPSLDGVGTNLQGLVANAPNDMYAFGYSADPSGYGFDSLIVHWNGNAWKVIPSPNPRNDLNYIQNDLLTGVVPSPGNVWILGEQFGSQGGGCTGSCSLALQTTSGK